MLQPLVENAIYHMEFMDGDERNLYKRLEERIWRTWCHDNGLGMTEEQVARLFSDRPIPRLVQRFQDWVKNVNEADPAVFWR